MGSGLAGECQALRSICKPQTRMKTCRCTRRQGSAGATCLLEPMQMTGLVSTKNVTLMAAAFTAGYAKEVLDEHHSLKVYNVSRENSLVLFENSIYTTVINTKPLPLGRALAEIFEVPQVALDAFCSSLCANAQDYLGRWRVQAGQIGNENQNFLVQHEPTQSLTSSVRMVIARCISPVSKCRN